MRNVEFGGEVREEVVAEHQGRILRLLALRTAQGEQLQILGGKRPDLKLFDQRCMSLGLAPDSEHPQPRDSAQGQPEPYCCPFPHEAVSPTGIDQHIDILSVDVALQQRAIPRVGDGQLRNLGDPALGEGGGRV